MNINEIRTRQSINVIANTTELTARVIKDIAGDEIASTLNNRTLAYDALRGLILSRMQQNLNKMKGIEDAV